MEPLVELAVRCAHCQQPATTARLFDGVLAHDFFGCEMRIEPALQAPLLAAMIAGDVAAMHALRWDVAPYFCRQCRASYCSKCWRGVPEFDDGFYDVTRGTCPHGHEQTIDD